MLYKKTQNRVSEDLAFVGDDDDGDGLIMEGWANRVLWGKVSRRVSLCKTSPHVHFFFFMIIFSDTIQPMIVDACSVLIFGKYLRFGSGLI